MKRIIDIDENIFTRLFDCVDDGELSLSHDELDRLETSVRNGIPYEERSQGEWEKCQNGMFRCSKCRQADEVPTAMGAPIYNFCPNCGVKMRGSIE